MVKEKVGKKIVFFDIDGTLYSYKQGIPESTKEAIKMLKQAGHEAFICTGRTRCFIPAEVENLNFSGIVANCGAFIEHEGKVLLQESVPENVAEESLYILRRCGIIPIMEGTDYLYFDRDEYTDEVDGLANGIFKQLGNHYKPIRGNEKNLEISKITAKILQDSRIEQACKDMGRWYEYVLHEKGWGVPTMEFIMKGITKGSAIAFTCEKLGIDLKNSVCFGDSGNDMAMFETAHTKVAMGNSVEEIKRMADYVTGDYLGDGIYQGLKHLELI